jgi:2-amino-4-hydroxy-6-hydroxymethyldihydropteridine diphosphokinase
MPLAYIALGANLPSSAGPAEATLTEAAKRLGNLGQITRFSRLYSTEPVGFSNQPRFVNAVVALETGLTPRALLNNLLSIEHDFGRDRSSGIRNGPRTLDLDILLYSDAVVREPGLDIPHPRLAERAFALVPMHEIAPSLLHPESGQTVKELLETLLTGKRSGENAPIPIHWDGWPACVRAGCGDQCVAPDQPDTGKPEPYGRR